MTQERMIEKLRKVLALTNSPVEGEAQAAAETLQRLLLEHNLSIADLEKGGFAAPGVHEKSHDLGTAAFAWKLDLAETIADHYLCYGIVNRTDKTVRFVGRPDNVESLKMLYAWIIDQIKRISSDARRQHIAETGEHIDPLRWQLNFGLGAVQRLGIRLQELKEMEAQDETCISLVLHHATEISDYLEKEHGFRADGKPTQRTMKWRAEYEEQKRQDDELLESDPVAYYVKYPYRHPDAVAKANEEYEKRARRRKPRAERVRYMSDAEWNRLEQAQTASRSGRESADKINLQPFLKGKAETKEVE